MDTLKHYAITMHGLISHQLLKSDRLTSTSWHFGMQFVRISDICATPSKSLRFLFLLM